jgi:EmrB/QacA subfamily drug resistance transporter
MALPIAAEPPVGLRMSSPAGRWVLAASVLGSGMAALDATVVGIALPRIGKDFHAGVSSLQWVVTAYTLTLAAFLLLGGTLGDRFGRRRIFAVGIVWFALASALCGAAPNDAVLIAARALQGIGGALLAPGSLALLQSSFVPEDRAKAIGAWSGLGGVATAAGPLVGGYLLAVSTWRWVFLINVPLAVAVLLITARHVPESADPGAGRIDLGGGALGVLWLSALTYGLIEAPDAGWTSPQIIVAFVVSVVGVISFAVVESTVRQPMLPGGIFADRQFSAANAVTFLVYGALGGALFLLPVSLQQVSGYTPLAAGLSLLPLTLIMLTFSARSGRLATRIGPRVQMSVGPVVAGAGLMLLARSAHDHAYLTGVLPGVLLLGVGLTTAVAPLTSTAMASAPVEHAGLASAVNNDVARVAGLLTVALLPSLVGLTGAAYLHPSTFGRGFQHAMIVCGALAVVAGLLAAVTISNGALRHRSRRHLLDESVCLSLAGPPATAPATGTPAP